MTRRKAERADMIVLQRVNHAVRGARGAFNKKTVNLPLPVAPELGLLCGRGHHR
jgi:hypothetical protein